MSMRLWKRWHRSSQLTHRQKMNECFPKMSNYSITAITVYMTFCDLVCMKQYAHCNAAAINTILSNSSTMCCHRSFNTWFPSLWPVCQSHLQPTCSVDSLHLHLFAQYCRRVHTKVPTQKQEVTGCLHCRQHSLWVDQFLWVLVEFPNLVLCSYKAFTYKWSEEGRDYKSTITHCAFLEVTVLFT